MITVTTTGIRLTAVAAACVATSLLAACASSTTRGSGQAVAPTSGAPSSSASIASSGPGSSSSSASSSAVPVTPAPSTPLATHTVKAGSRTYVVKIWARKHDADCVSHAYGVPMIAFLKAHPCSGLDRVLATTTVNGRAIGYAESSTGFAGTPDKPYAVAAAFKDLALANGTGSLNDLLREGYRLPSGPTAIPSSEAFGVIGQDNGVAVWDLWYLDGPTPDQDKTLLRVITDLYLQF